MVATRSLARVESLGQVGVVVCLIAMLGCTSGASSNRGVTYNADNSTVSFDTVAAAGDAPAVAPDGPAACPTGICNYQTQVGCSVATDAATVVASCIPTVTKAGATAPTCVVAGSIQEGDECSGWEDCSSGLVCAGLVCRRLCCGHDWTACSPDQRCVAPLSISINSSAVPTGAYVCVPANGCDPLTGSPCTGATVCQIVDPTGATACVASPPAGVGATPGDVCPPCQTGFTCVSEGCRRLCSVAATSGQGGATCPPEEGHCVHWQRDPKDIGECTPVD